MRCGGEVNLSQRHGHARINLLYFIYMTRVYDMSTILFIHFRYSM